MINIFNRFLSFWNSIGFYLTLVLIYMVEAMMLLLNKVIHGAFIVMIAAVFVAMIAGIVHMVGSAKEIKALKEDMESMRPEVHESREDTREIIPFGEMQHRIEQIYKENAELRSELDKEKELNILLQQKNTKLKEQNMKFKNMLAQQYMSRKHDELEL